MSDHQNDNPQRPTTDAPDEWKAYWAAQGMPWRREPEIDEKRQQYLGERRVIPPDIENGVYPFKDIGQKLTRADIEWLLATLRDRFGSGPITTADEHPSLRAGLDLRGADLRGLDLSGLPLSMMQGGFERHETEHILPRWSEREAALSGAAAHLEEANLNAAHLENAILFGAHLEHAKLTGAYLEGAFLDEAHLDHASLGGAHMEGAWLLHAQMKVTILTDAHLQSAKMFRANLERAYLLGAKLAGADLEAARLGGAVLHSAQLAGGVLPDEDMQRISKWNVRCPQVLTGATLREAFMNEETVLNEAVFIDLVHGSAEVVDVHWGGVNLAVVRWVKSPARRTFWAWSKSVILGDERKASEPLMENGKPKTEQSSMTAFSNAARANRQLATVLRSQGLDESADRYAYRAQLCQRQLLRLPGSRKIPAYLWSLFLWAIAGYGYRVGRILVAYVGVLALFTFFYFFAGLLAGTPLSLPDAILVSFTAVHGRVFLGQFGLHSLLSWIAGIEAVVGIVIEGVFVAMLIQRFFSR